MRMLIQLQLHSRKYHITLEWLNCIALNYCQPLVIGLSFCADAIIVQSRVHYSASKKFTSRRVGEI
jgi:hypothetical protein